MRMCTVDGISEGEMLELMFTISKALVNCLLFSLHQHWQL